MRACRGQAVEIGSLEEFDRRLRLGASSLSGWRLVGVDLTERSAALRGCRVAGALFLGCALAPGDEESVRSRGAIVFPELPDIPVEVYRSQLYSPAELYDTTRYEATFDARAYAWSQQPTDRERALAMALHDHGVDEALTGWLVDRQVVGVMGGHALVRGEPGYADAARLGMLLAGHATVATGGGPGAMEAANLGAWLAGHTDDDLRHALDLLAAAPSFRPDVAAWVAAAHDVLATFPHGGESLGVPTWHYGHEPPNPFATAIAKYFKNSTREAILLQICNRGIVFLPGAAGTVQEVFQDACENYYADESSVARMVLVGVEHWTRDVPAWPLLERLAAGRTMQDRIHLVETVEEAAELVVS